MAQMVLVMGESGTGKTTSIRNCDPAATAIVNPVGKSLPFKGKFEMLNNEVDAAEITRYMKGAAASGKKLIIVDDFQYILAVPYMNRIKETGWDKYNDFGANYFEIIEICKELPDDVVVAYLTHLETLDNGLTTVKLIGKLLREKITIEGLFTVVLKTSVTEGKYYFLTQNSGKDTVKSPLGMFPAYAIDNDLNYVAEKIRSYYEAGAYKTDAEMQSADQAVAADLVKPDAKGRRARTSDTPVPAAVAGRRSRSHDEVVADNKTKSDQYMEDCAKAVDKVVNGREEVPFEEASAAIDKVQKPELETPPRKTRAEHHGCAEPVNQTVTLDQDTCFYVPADDNYIRKHKGDTVQLIVDGVEAMKEITEKEFGEGIKRLATQGNEPAPRQRKARNIEPVASVSTANAVEENMNAPEPAEQNEAVSGRRRRTR